MTETKLDLDEAERLTSMVSRQTDILRSLAKRFRGKYAWIEKAQAHACDVATIMEETIRKNELLLDFVPLAVARLRELDIHNAVLTNRITELERDCEDYDKDNADLRARITALEAQAKEDEASLERISKGCNAPWMEASKRLAASKRDLKTQLEDEGMHLSGDALKRDGGENG